jgi:hypothetical protein
MKTNWGCRWLGRTRLVGGFRDKEIEIMSISIYVESVLSNVIGLNLYRQLRDCAFEDEFLVSEVWQND